MRAGIILVSARPGLGEGRRFASSDVLPGITKATLPIAREKKVLPASWAPTQPAAAVCLASMTSQQSKTCSWEPRVLQRGWPGRRTRPPHVLPGTLCKAAPHPPAWLPLGKKLFALISIWLEETLGIFLPPPSRRLPIPPVPAARPDLSPLPPADLQVQGRGLCTGWA